MSSAAIFFHSSEKEGELVTAWFVFMQYFLQCYSQIQKKKVSSALREAGIYSVLIFLISVITKSCAQNLLKALNILHIKSIEEDWKKLAVLLFQK